MSLEKYTISLLSGGEETPVTPRIVDLLFEDSIEEKVLGIYRRRLKTEMVFKGSDYELLTDHAAFGNQWNVLIRYEGDLSYTGRLTMGTSRVRFDADACLAYVTVDPVDDYTCLFDSWEDEINILSGGDALSSSSLAGNFNIFVCELIPCTGDDCYDHIDDCIDPAEGWTLYTHTITTTDNPAETASFTGWIREELNLSCLSSGGTPTPPGDEWILTDDNCPAYATFARPVATAYSPSKSFSNDFPTEANTTFYAEVYDIMGRKESGGEYVYDNGRLMSWILEHFNPCSSAGIVSDFLSINGDDTYPANSVYASAKTNLQYLAAWQKSDVKRPTVSDNATIGKWTYKEILESLAEHFNIQIDIQGGNLRIEHVSYFEASEGLDLTTLNGGKWLLGRNEWSYEDEDAYKKEIWRFMEETSIDFVADPVSYSLPSSFPSEKPHDLGKVNNDIGFITANLDKVSDEGFVLAPLFYNSGTYSLMSHTSAKTGALLLNGYMSQPNLLETFHKHNRLFSVGTMNGTSQTFSSSVKRRKQETIEIRLDAETYWGSFSAKDLVKTQLGWAQVQKAEYSAKSCILKLDLIHD